MAEFLSPGVFIEEIPSQTQVVSAASTSNMGAAGFTVRGPTDTATLVTSFDAFNRTFGGFTRDSFMPHTMAAFFANGGRRAYVVRVAPADAVAADCKLQSVIKDQQIETGDGATTAFTKTATTSTLKDNAGSSPIVAGTFVLRWREAGTPVVAGIMKKRDGTTNLVCVPAQASYEGHIGTAALPTFDSELDSVVRNTVVITMVVAAAAGAANVFTVPVGTSSIVSVTIGDATNGGICTLDHRSGRFSIRTYGTSIPAGGDTANITANFTPAAATLTTTDDGAGNIVGAGGASTITYADGAYTLTATGNAPHNQARVLATYTINAWDLDPISKGIWGNNLRVQVNGNPDYYTAATGQYTKFNLQVLLENDLGFETLETYEELVFDDATSTMYFPDVINEMSDLLTVTEPGSDERLADLLGQARTMVIAGGNLLTPDQVITATLTNGPIQPRSLSISWTNSAGTAMVVTDNGNGALTGDIDATGTNTINYTSGALALKTSATVRGATLVTVSYYSAPTATVHTEDFGDQAVGKLYTVGTDGTFDSTNYGRNQFTLATLGATYDGIYALNRIEEIMQVVVPDFAGDVTITGDLLDYADGRAALSSGGDRFIILTVPKGSSAQEAVDWFRFDLGRFSKFAALYWPWIKVADPLANNRPLVVPPMGHVAGIYARTDSTKNVGKAPAGTVDGALRYLIGLEMDPNQGERDVVYPNKINAFISGPATGLAVWGARTIAQESEWRYINVRRLFMFLERSVYNSTAWVVFENNGPNLWARLKAQINGFLNSLFVDGYFAGNTPSQAYSVVIDESNNNAATIEAGQLIIDVGVAANKPAEFVRFRFQQLTLG